MSKELGPNSSLIELCDELRPPEGVSVVPVSLGDRDDGRQDYILVVTGAHEEATLMTSNLMRFVNELHDLAEQKKADDTGSIIVPA